MLDILRLMPQIVFGIEGDDIFQSSVYQTHTDSILQRPSHAYSV